MARRHEYAQHFLRSPRLVAELIGHSNIRKNDTVYDLGAGSGVITSVLAGRCKKVVAVEIEPKALFKLRQNLGHVDNVEIITRSILDLALPTEPYKIFANIPFNLSAGVVRQFTETDLPPRSMYLITQKQFARKLVPGNDHFTSQLSAEIGPWFTARIRKPLRKTDFTPPPAVDTVLLEIKPRETPLIDHDAAADYRTFVGDCFGHQPTFARTNRAGAGISPEKRPSELTVEEWLRLFAISRKV